MVICPLNTVLNWETEFEKWLSVDDRLDVSTIEFYIDDIALRLIQHTYVFYTLVQSNICMLCVFTYHRLPLRMCVKRRKILKTSCSV